MICYNIEACQCRPVANIEANHYLIVMVLRSCHLKLMFAVCVEKKQTEEKNKYLSPDLIYGRQFDVIML